MFKNIESIEELELFASKYSSGHIFRGQTNHYLIDEGGISINTSFNRKGCVPPVMQKWNFYCEEILRYHKGPEFEGKVDLVECQAVLQHYGWRSFFIDFSRRIEVSCWFASNVYSEKITGQIGEDWQEIGLWSLHKEAFYSPHSGFGYLYVVDEAQLAINDIHISDLERFRFSDFSSRFDRQSAVMLGPLSKLPDSVIVATLCVPVEILQQYSKDLSAAELFPGRDEDLIYKSLLDPPFVLKNYDGHGCGDYGPYVRDLDIPEYDYKFVKRLSPNIAFYRYRYLINPNEAETVVIRVPDHFLHHVDIDSDGGFHEVLNLFNDTEVLIIESEGIIRWPTYFGTSLYLKGVEIRRIAVDEIRISGLLVRHPGSSLNQIIVDDGWRYKIADGYLMRANSEADCPCNNKRKHLLEKAVVEKLQRAVVDGQIRAESNFYVVIN